MDTEAWLSERQRVFDDADFNNDGILDVSEGRRFFENVRPLDLKGELLDTQFERIDKHWIAASILNEPTDNMSFDDYIQLEKTMEAWYSAGKLDVTGHANNWNPSPRGGREVGSPGDYLSHTCETLNLDFDDRVTYMRIISNTDGVQQLDIQTSKIPTATLGKRDSARFAYVNTNWVEFDGTVDLAGLWGTTREDGTLAGLGFIERDSKCTQEFLDEVGEENYTWVSPKPSELVTRPEYPEEYKSEIQNLLESKDLIASGQLPQHEHEEKAETGLVVVTIIVYVAVAILLMVMIYQYCKEKKMNRD